MTIRHFAVCAGLTGWLACGGVGAQEPAGGPPAVEAAGAAAVDEAPPAKRLTLLELLLKGGSLMYPLALASIVMVAFAIERGLALRRARVLPADTMDTIRNALDSADELLDTERLRRKLDEHSNPLSRVAGAGLRKANRTIQEIEKAIEDAGAKEAGAMRRNCRVLSMVASIAPLLGLTGTVTGMIKSFMTVAARAEALGRTELLAAGIYEALVTTAVGLAIAIPSLVCYYFYMEKVESFVVELDSVAEDLIEKIPTRG
jgi:biopolymer transport protein ExbB